MAKQVIMNVPESELGRIVAGLEADGVAPSVRSQADGRFAVSATGGAAAAAATSLDEALARPDPRPVRPALEFAGAALPLEEADYERAAETVGCDVAAIKAVSDVESAGAGFLADKRPKILFEAHVFSRRTGGVYDKSHPHVSAPKWDKSLYGRGGAHQYTRLAAAMALDRNAALASASWGRFQIMGFNYEACGFPGVAPFVAAMTEREGRHLDAFIGFVMTGRLDAALRAHDWAAFARGYNGPAYAENAYDTKMAAAWAKHAGGRWLTPRQVQAALNRAGAQPPLAVDGDIGPSTRKALKAFQQRHGLAETGRLSPEAMSRLLAV